MENLRPLLSVHSVPMISNLVSNLLYDITEVKKSKIPVSLARQLYNCKLMRARLERRSVPCDLAFLRLIMFSSVFLLIMYSDGAQNVLCYRLRASLGCNRKAGSYLYPEWISKFN
jgi:hypothetical protein